MTLLRRFSLYKELFAAQLELCHVPTWSTEGVSGHLRSGIRRSEVAYLVRWFWQPMYNMHAPANGIKFEIHEPIYISTKVWFNSLVTLLPWPFCCLLSGLKIFFLTCSVIKTAVDQASLAPLPSSYYLCSTTAQLLHSHSSGLCLAWGSKAWISTMLQARALCLVGLSAHRTLAKGSASQRAALRQKLSPATGPSPPTCAPPVTPIPGCLLLRFQSLTCGASDIRRLFVAEAFAWDSTQFPLSFLQVVWCTALQATGIYLSVNNQGK